MCNEYNLLELQNWTKENKIDIEVENEGGMYRNKEEDAFRSSIISPNMYI